MAPSLSLCIPTYNRAGMLRALLDSIVRECPRETEVVVSDNASTDGTAAVVEEYRRHLPHLRWHQWPSNVGPEPNFLKAIELATTDFCWLMGSDDQVEAGAYAAITSFLAQHPQVGGVSVNLRSYSFDLARVIAEPPLTVGGEGDTRPLHGAELIVSQLGNMWGFMSAQVLRRELWQRVVREYDVPRYFIGYVHLYVMCQMVRLHPQWGFVGHRCVGWRSGNDEALQELGFARRALLDIRGFHTILRDTFGVRSPAYRQVMAEVARANVRNALLAGKLSGLPYRSFFPVLAGAVPIFWTFPEFWWRSAWIALVPAGVFRLARRVRRARRRPS